MVYIHSWQEFQDAAEVLYAKAPNKARYCIKWRPSEGKLVLKITDDTTCIKFKTFSSIFLNRFESLNLTLMQKMQNRRQKEAHAAEPPLAASSSAPPPNPTPELAAPVPGTMTTTPTTAALSAGGVAKKKKPKKKK